MIKFIQRIISIINNSLVSEGCKIYGTVINSVLSGGVVVEAGAIVKDAVVMEDVIIKKNASVFSAIIDAEAEIERGVTVGKENADISEITVIAKAEKVCANTAVTK